MAINKVMNRDECDQIFDELKHCNTEEDFAATAKPLFNFYETSAVAIQAQSLWRARKIENKPYQFIKELLAPKEGINPQRFNDHNESVLYCAFDIETALAEINAKDGDLVQAINFSLQTLSELRLVIIGEYFNMVRRGPEFFKDQAFKRTTEDWLNQLPQEDARTQLYIDKLLYELITDPLASEKNYISTRSIKKLINKQQDGMVDGFIYRSAKPSSGFNLVIFNKHDEHFIKIHKSQIIAIEKYRKYGFIDYWVNRETRLIDNFSRFIWKN